MRRNKKDKNHTFDLAELMRIGWYKETQVRTIDAQFIRSMLAARYQLRMLPRYASNVCEARSDIPPRRSRLKTTPM
jgi:hypothetical protein